MVYAFGLRGANFIKLPRKWPRGVPRGRVLRVLQRRPELSPGAEAQSGSAIGEPFLNGPTAVEGAPAPEQIGLP